MALQAFLDIKTHFKLEDIWMSFHAEHTKTSNTNFELDCVAVRGYQLFAVSCTVDKKAVAKDHLIEVQARARQLGGDEARIALVCTTEDKKALLSEIQRDLDSGDRIKVFGREDIGNLSIRFEEWVKECI